MFETIISQEWVTRHQSMFENIRFLILDNLRATEEDSFHASNSNITPPFHKTQPLVRSFRGIGTDASESTLSRGNNEIYLDISYTHRSEGWLRNLKTANYRNLRVLKISGMGLTDRTFPRDLLTYGPYRLWSLDVRDNLLGDGFIESLLRRYAIAPQHELLQNPKEPIFAAYDENIYDNPPYYSKRDIEEDTAPFNTLAPMREDSLEPFKNYLLMNGNLQADPRRALPKDDIYMRATGLTHLYLSINKFSDSVLRELLQSNNNRLQALDIGSTIVPKLSMYLNSPCLPSSTVVFAAPDCAKYLKRATGTRIQKLRIHHSFVTLVPTVANMRNSLQGGYHSDLVMEAEKLSELAHDDTTPGFNWGEPFQPQDNYGITHLTLTDIPTISHGPVIARLVALLSSCAEQESILANARKQPAQKRYRAPPLLNGLRVLRFEFLCPMPMSQKQKMDDSIAVGGIAGSGGCVAVKNVKQRYGASVSGDPDADTYAFNAAGDFSFFSNIISGSNTKAVSSCPGPITREKQDYGGDTKMITIGNLDAEKNPARDVNMTKRSGATLREEVTREETWGKGIEREEEKGKGKEKEKEVWPKDVVSELKKFRENARPIWGGELQIVRPIHGIIAREMNW